jgi:colicin import membrane protein
MRVQVDEAHERLKDTTGEHWHMHNTESSVLFSLNELKRLETDRQEDERQAERARLEAERRTRLEAERLAREAEERRLRADEARRVRQAQARERARRNDELRHRGLEQRLALEAQLAIDKARVEAEARAMVSLRQSSPWPRVLIMTAALMGVVGSGVFYYMRATDDELARQRAVAEARERQEAAQLAAREASTERELAAELDRLRAQLKSTASTAAEPVARPTRPVESRRHAPRKTAPKAKTQTPAAPANSDDPLGLIE